MTTEWPDELSIELINKVREHGNLWDPYHLDKKKMQERRTAGKKSRRMWVDLLKIARRSGKI